MKKIKICVFTGSRAEYGLLKPLIDELKNEREIELQLIISGMHLSPEFGMTVNEISIEGISKVERVEILLSSDTPTGVSKAMGLGMISFAETYERLKPDIIIGLGDRFELFSAVAAALVARIPVAHIHGGELTLGAYDDGFRHAITKMAHLHFTSTEEYRKRVIQLGENPKNVFNVGAIGLDNIKNMKLLSLKELEKSINFILDKPFFIVTFHAVTLEKNSAGNQTKELLNALNEFSGYKILFTKPNADNDSRIIIKMIDDFVRENNSRAAAFDSLGQLRYLSALKHADMIIGNSSSGIIEMPSFNKPTINIGDRQKGRIFPKSVIQSEPNKKSIADSITKGLSDNFNRVIKNIDNIYGDGKTAKRIKKNLLRIHTQNLIKKDFYDIRKPAQIC